MTNSKFLYKKYGRKIPTVNGFIKFFQVVKRAYFLPKNTASYTRRKTEDYRFLKNCGNHN